VIRDGLSRDRGNKDRHNDPSSMHHRWSRAPSTSHNNTSISITPCICRRPLNPSHPSISWYVVVTRPDGRDQSIGAPINPCGCEGAHVSPSSSTCARQSSGDGEYNATLAGRLSTRGDRPLSNLLLVRPARWQVTPLSLSTRVRD